jgi:hypothetical protein
MKKKWIYIFSKFQKPNIFKILACIVSLLSIVLSLIFIPYNVKNEKERVEYDPRKTISVNYKNVKSIETNNNPDDLKIYFNDDKYVHIRKEKNLVYTSVPNSEIKDFSVYGDESIILDDKNNVYVGDSNLNKKDLLIRNYDKGPSNLGSKIYQYKNKIVVFDGNLYLYDTDKNYWTNLNKELNISKSFLDVFYNSLYFITTTSTEVFVFDPNSFTLQKVLHFNKIDDISLDENEFYILSDGTIYKYYFESNKLEKIFSQSRYEGEKILGVRYYNGAIFLLTDYGLSIYQNRTWKNIKIEGIKRDFYISDAIYVITDKKIHLVGENISYEYDENYFFDGKKMYFRKGNDIYKIENNIAEKFFNGYKGKFEDFNPNDIVEAHFVNDKLILISKNAIYEYDFEKREYKKIEKNVKNIVFNKNLYYMLGNQLYMYNFTEKKILAKNVVKYDVSKDVVLYIDSNRRLNALKNNTHVVIFQENYDFDLKSLLYLMKVDEELLLVDKYKAIVLDLKNYLVNSEIDFEDDEITKVKKFDDEHFALIGKNKIYFFENKKLLKKIPYNQNITNTRGDYIVLKVNEQYIFYNKFGEKAKIDGNITMPFSFSSVVQMFALDNKVYFRLKTGDIYKFEPKLILSMDSKNVFEKLNIKYENEIEKISKINDEYYCISQNTLYKFLTKEKIRDNVIDYAFINNKFYYLTNDNYIISQDGEHFFDNSRKVEGNYLSSTIYNGNLYLFFTEGIEKIELDKFNISNFKTKILDVVVNNNYAIIVNNIGEVSYFNLDKFNIETSKTYKNSTFSINNKEIYVTTEHKVYNLSSNFEKLVYDFNLQNNIDYVIKNVYFYNNNLYFLGDNFYAVYSPNEFKWLFIKDNIQINDSNYINNKIYVKLGNGKIGYLDYDKFIEDKIPDFDIHRQYSDYFIDINQPISTIKAIYNRNDILLVLTQDSLLMYNIKKYSWHKVEIFSNIIAGYPEKDGIIIVQPNKLTKYYSDLSKKELNVNFNRYWYSDSIVLYNSNDNKFIAYNKDLDKIAEKKLSKFPNKIDEMYYIDDVLYLISGKTIYTYDKIKGISKHDFKNPEIIFRNGRLFVIDNIEDTIPKKSLVYEFDKGLRKELLKDVLYFAVKDNNYIYSDAFNNVYVNEEKIFDYKIKSKIEFFYPIDEDNIVILDRKSNLYVYNLKNHKVVEEYENNEDLKYYSLKEDKLTKNKYLFWQSNNEKICHYYDLSKRFYKHVDLQGNIIDFTAFGNIIYFMYDKKVVMYKDDQFEKVIELPVLPKIKYAYQFNGKYYVKDENDRDYLVSENLFIEQKDKIIDKKYFIDNTEIFLVNNDFYDQSGLKLPKPKFSKYFEYDYKIGNYLISTKNKTIFDLKNFSVSNFRDYEIHSNFIRVDDKLITEEGIKLVDSISKIYFDNIPISLNESYIEKLFVLNDEGKEKRKELIDKYEKLLGKNVDEEIYNTKSDLKNVKEDIKKLFGAKKEIEKEIEKELNLNFSADNLENLLSEERSLKNEKEKLEKDLNDLNLKINDLQKKNQENEMNIKELNEKIEEYEKKEKETNNGFIEKFIKLFGIDNNEKLKKEKRKLEDKRNEYIAQIEDNNNMIDSINFEKDIKLDKKGEILLKLNKILKIKLEKLEKIKDLIDNFHKYYPDYLIPTLSYRINKEDIINLDDKKVEPVLYEKLDFESFKREILKYSKKRGYLQRFEDDGVLSLKKEYKSLERFQQYSKRYIIVNNFIYFEDKKYFVKGDPNLKVLDNIFIFKDKIYTLVNGVVKKLDQEISPYTQGSLVIDKVGSIKYSPYNNGLYYEENKMFDYVFEKFSLKNNQIIFEGNFFAYDLSKNIRHKNELFDLNDEINERYKIVIGSKISLVPFNGDYILTTINGKLYFDVVTKVAIGKYAYAFIPNVGILNLDTLRYEYLGNIDNLITADNGVFVDISGKIFKIDNGLKSDSKIIIKNQSIYFDSKFKAVESNSQEFYYFNQKVTKEEFYKKIYNIFSNPLNAVYYNNNFVFNNLEFLYNLNGNEINIIDKKSYENPLVINDKLFDLKKVKDLPQYLKKYKVNINIYDGIFEIKENSENELYYDNKKINKTITEDILKIYTYDSSKYIVTKNYIFELTDNIELKQRLNNIVNVKRILDYLILTLQDKKLIYDIEKNTIEKYNNQKLSIDLDKSKMEFGSYNVKFANSYYDIKDFSLSKEIFGLENIKGVVKKENDYYFLLESNKILKKSNNQYKLFKIPFKAERIDLVSNEIIVNKEYSFNEIEFRKLSNNDLIKLFNMKDLVYKDNQLSISHSNDLNFDYFWYNIKTIRPFFEKIFNIKSNNNKLIIVANNGVIEYELGMVKYKKILDISETYKLFNDIFIKSDNKYYIFTNEINDWDNRINNSIIINFDYTVSNTYDLTSKIYFKKEDNKFDVTFNDYFNINPYGNIRASIHNNSIMIFKENIYLNNLKENIKEVYVKNKNIIAIDSKGNEYMVTSDSVELYKTDEFDFWSFDLLDNKSFSTKDKVELKINGITLKDLNEIKPTDVFIFNGTFYLENKYGIFKNLFREVFDISNVLYKKRINEWLLVKTNSKELKSYEEKFKDLNVKIVFDGNNFREELSEKFEFKYKDFKLNDLILDGVFVFDIIKDFNVTDRLYLSNDSGIWKKLKFPFYLSSKKLDKYFVTNDKVYEKSSLKNYMLNANMLELYIDSNMNIEERKNVQGEYVKIENMTKSFINNVFVFDIMEKILKTDDLYNINKYGIFSKNHIIKLENVNKILDTHNEYLQDKEKYLIVKGEKVEYIPKKIKVSDNKWIWNLSNGSVIFINKFNQNLKRVYLNNYFMDDLIKDVYIEKNRIYMLDEMGYVEIYENYIPIDMQEYKNQKLSEFEKDEIKFSSRKYKYTYKNNKFYVEKEK